MEENTFFLCHSEAVYFVGLFVLGKKYSACYVNRFSNSKSYNFLILTSFTTQEHSSQKNVTDFRLIHMLLKLHTTMNRYLLVTIR